VTDGIKNYFELVGKPWGRMFYDLIYLQLNIPETPKLRILDFGSGFGICSNHYAQHHEVTAIEPNADMISLRFCDNQYKQLHGGIEILSQFNAEFDLVLCHNVLEYARNQEDISTELAKTLNPGGRLSVVKHNTYGRVMASAVFEENPEKAINLLDDVKTDQRSSFGDRFLYSEKDILFWADKNELTLTSQYGIRTFFALTQNNDIKFDAGWYGKMLELEYKACNIDEFKKIAFFNHFIFQK